RPQADGLKEGIVDVSVIHDELRRGEHILWTGQPATGLKLSLLDLYLVPFSLAWGGFAFFWEWEVLRSGAPLLFTLFGIPFVAVGSYLIVGRFFWDAYRRRQTVYAITNERILIVVRAVGSRTMSLPLSTIPQAMLTGDRHRGSITFGSLARTSAAWATAGT